MNWSHDSGLIEYVYDYFQYFSIFQPYLNVAWLPLTIPSQ